MDASTATPLQQREIDLDQARAVVRRAIARYLEARQARIEPFVDANFSLVGTIRLHRHALGPDLLRAPANVALVLPYLILQLSALALAWSGARKTAGWLKRRRLFLETDVARELTWRLHVDLLEIPFADRHRRSTRDALSEEVLADPLLADAAHRIEQLLRRPHADPEVERRFRVMLETYAGARNAAADLVNNALLAGAGGALFQKLTPGTFTLGPVIAAALAQQAAVASFPLGATLGGLWYGWFPVTPSPLLTIGATLALMLACAATAAFAGIVSDPVQRALGFHQRRLRLLIDALGRELEGQDEAAFEVRDHYVARIFDLIDLARATYRSV